MATAHGERMKIFQELLKAAERQLRVNRAARKAGKKEEEEEEEA